MISIRRASERGHANHGWLDTRHTFSFADYYDPAFMGFHSLRVINEDRVKAGAGFGTHPHRDMEIISYVLEGALEHRDSMENGSIIRPGDVQRMSAGTGVTHSEFNASKEEVVHFLQLWLLPSQRGIKPGYEQKRFTDEEKLGTLRLIASPDGANGSVIIHSPAILYAGIFPQGTAYNLPIAPRRHAWVHIARGNSRVNGHELMAGDSAAFSDEAEVQIIGIDRGEILVFDLEDLMQ